MIKEADILATTYWDWVDVYRPCKETLPSGESVFKSGREGRLVYEGAACALSTHSGGQLNQNPSTATADTFYNLFTRPEVEIYPNDFLVITHLGKVTEALAGKPERHVSHNNVPIRLAEATV